MPNEIITGALRGKGEYDWLAGGNSPIQRRILNKNRNWKEIFIPNEVQIIGYGTDKQYESLLCVSFNGTTDAIEYIMMRQIELGLIPEEKLQWLVDKGYFENDKLNFNERYTGIIGGTSEIGAYVWSVAKGMKDFGLIPQKMFPFADNFKDNIDKKFLTQEMLNLGLEFKKRFPINFEWIAEEDTQEYLQYSPLACIGKYGNYQEGELLDPTGKMYHSMLMVNETQYYREIDDSYFQQYKKYKPSALNDFMAFYVDATDYSMFNREQFISTHDQYIVRNRNTGAYLVIYRKTPMIITPERASLFLLDRVERGIVSDKNLVTTVSNDEWLILDPTMKF